MDLNELGRSCGIGFGVGLLFMFISTIALLPASYFMNRFVYHSGAMRFLLMIFSIALAPIFFVVLLAGRMFGFIKPTHYFGLFPFILPQSLVAVGWPAWLVTTFVYLMHPFVMFYQGDADKQGFIAAVEMLTGKEDEKKVDEKLYAAARDAGAETYLSKWHDGIKKIQELFKIIPGKDVSMETCKDDEKLAAILRNVAPEKPSKAGNNAKMQLFAEKLGALGLLNKPPQQPEKELTEEEFKAEVKRENKHPSQDASQSGRIRFYPLDPEKEWQEEKKRREAKAAAAPVTNPASSQTPTGLAPGPKSPSPPTQTNLSSPQTNPSGSPVV